MKPPGEPLRLGFIGCGMISSAHAAAVRLLAEDGIVRLVAAADPDPEGIDRVASITGGVDRRSADGFDVIADPDVDAIVLITPTRFHREYALAVAEAGKPLFTEKPLAPTFPSCASCTPRCWLRASLRRSVSNRGSTRSSTGYATSS